MVLVIFAKPPRPGRVKTRLAAEIGERAAADIASASLADLWAQLTEWGHGELVLSTPSPEAEHGLPRGARTVHQGAGGLGARIERTFQALLGSANRVIALGADTPWIPPHVLDRARHTPAPAVLGPAEDGGFYLLGLDACPTGLFDGLPWSSPRTAQATTARLTQAGMAPMVLEPWFDLDTLQDLHTLRTRVTEGGAPRTLRTAKRLGLIS
jgi:uncharacterized protein